MVGDCIRRILYGKEVNDSMPPVYNDPILEIYGSTAKGGNMLQLTDEQMRKGVLFIGATGSGKTYSEKRFIKELRDNSDDYSMVIVQTKNDFNETYRYGDLLLKQGSDGKDSVRWNIFSDLLIDGYDWPSIELNTRDLVKNLFAYKNDTKEKFFVEGAAELLYCVIITYIREAEHSIHARTRLSNKGLMEFFKDFDEKDYRRVLNNCGERGVLNRILGGDTDNRQALGVWGELVTTMLQTFVDIFADEGDFSVRDFIRNKKNRALFLNYDPGYRDIQIAIYGTLINLMIKETLSEANVAGRVILVCDEMATIGKTDIPTAVNLGRAKGLITICGCQSVEQLYSIYGEHDAENMLAGLCTKLYFRPGDASTKTYMQNDFGTVLADYMILSTGGCYSERKEGFIIEDHDINSMNTGDCYIKMCEGHMFRFHFD